jgi:hypothetical protein
VDVMGFGKILQEPDDRVFIGEIIIFCYTQDVSFVERLGRISQLGEGWHSNGNALRFWSHALYAPKEESSRCYA